MLSFIGGNMKKIVLLLALTFSFPVYLSAQETDWWNEPLQVSENSIYAKFMTGRLENKYLQNTKNVANEYKRRSSFDETDTNAPLNPVPEHIKDVPMPTKGLYKVIFDSTNKAFAKDSESEVHIEKTGGLISNTIHDLFLPKGTVKLPDIPQDKLLNYAYSRAVKERQKILDELKKHTLADCTESHSSIFTSDGLKDRYVACVKKYKEAMAREEWIHYQEKNPIFKYYIPIVNYADFQSLEEEDYQNLVAFFSGQEPAEGWVYKEVQHPEGYLVNPSPLNGNKSVVYGKEILVRISDTLEASILPINLSVRIYKAPFAPANTYHFDENHFCTGWLNSKGFIVK